MGRSVRLADSGMAIKLDGVQVGCEEGCEKGCLEGMLDGQRLGELLGCNVGRVEGDKVGARDRAFV